MEIKLASNLGEWVQAMWFEAGLIRLYQIIMQMRQEIGYSNLEQQQDTVGAKIRRSSYLIVSISLLTHTFSLIYSLLTYKKSSAAFISIIVSSLSCFFISSSHLTIYGISVLGTLYITMVQALYSTYQMFYMGVMSGLIMFVFWKPIHSLGAIFHCLPGRIHASMVFGVVLIVLSRFFPLAIENEQAFFKIASESPLDSPIETLKYLFSSFNILTLVLTVLAIVGMLAMRKMLERIPLIGIMLVLGIVINYNHQFKSFSDLCSMEAVDCTFYVIDKRNIKEPTFAELLEVVPSSIVMAIVVIFEQFLYLEEFERRGKRFKSEGSLGEIKTQTKVLAVANIISGCLGGLPICINIFGTYESFAFNKKYGFKGTKWVGLLQIPFSFLLYTLLSKLFSMIPMFVLFIFVATPGVYFIKNVIAYHRKNLHIILFIAVVSLLTHPVVGLVFACFASIYEISELLKPAPAEMMVEGRDSSISGILSRKSSIMANVVEKNPDQSTVQLNQFANKVIEIDEDIPPEYVDKQYVLYRLIGSVNFMNYFQHLTQIRKITERYFKAEKSMVLMISLRYSQIMDAQSLNQMAYMVQNLREEGIKVVFTGLHERIMKEMQEIPYFALMLQQEQQTIYSINMKVS